MCWYPVGIELFPDLSATPVRKDRSWSGCVDWIEDIGKVVEVGEKSGPFDRVGSGHLDAVNRSIEAALGGIDPLRRRRCSPIADCGPLLDGKPNEQRTDKESDRDGQRCGPEPAEDDHCGHSLSAPAADPPRDALVLHADRTEMSASIAWPRITSSIGSVEKRASSNSVVSV